MAFNPLNWLLGFFSLDIGIDLGTANTLVNVRGKGITINEPSWVAIDKRTRQPLAIGAEAKEMVGRTPANVIAVRPLRDGVISEFEITQAMLEYFIGKAHEQSIVPVPRPRVVIGIPSGVTEVEKPVISYMASAGSPTESPPIAFPSLLKDEIFSAEAVLRSLYVLPCTIGKRYCSLSCDLLARLINGS